MKFSEKLIELRKAKGLSQEELGNMINVSRQAVSKWESEQSNPEIDKIKEISKTFNVSIDYLLDDKIDAPQQPTFKCNSKKILSLSLKLILILFVLYLIIVIYKFSVLLIFKNKANNYVFPNTYSVSIDSYMVDNGSSYSRKETTTYHNGIELTESYNEDSEQPDSITYINSKDRKAYNLMYSDEENKYVYEDLEIVNQDNLDKLYTTSQNNEFFGPSSLKEMFLFAINPKTKISFDANLLCITEPIENNVSQEIYINKDTGLLSEIRNISYDKLTSGTSYYYDFNNINTDYLTNEMFLEDINYIKELSK